MDDKSSGYDQSDNANADANPDDRRPYEVGYGKPPKSGQIKPGEVRNPRGKRPGTRSLKTDVVSILKMPVTMTKNGKVVRLTTLQASLAKLREKALKGDQRAIERFLLFAALYDEPDGSGGNTALLMAEDEAILAHAHERERQAHEATRPPFALPAPPAIDEAGEDPE